jgi:hypothetical protein
MVKPINRVLKPLLLRSLDPLARLLSRVLPVYVLESCRVRYFPLWEEHGFHLSPVHFYEPIPDTRTLTDALLEKESELVGIDIREADQLDLLRKVFPQFRAEYAEIPREPAADPKQFYLNNGYFTGADALVYYGMVRHFKPQLLIEVGSGFSSRLAAQACLRNGHGELICIEPNPDQVLRDGFPGLTMLIAKRVEEVGFDLFQRLRANDILFIDSSHVVRCGGDVNCLLLEIVPRLNPGVIVHLHDILLPQEYGRAWVIDRYRFFSEQYLLQAFLTFNTEFHVLFANRYMALKHQGEMAALFPNSSGFGSTSFWMRRRIESPTREA